MPNKKRGAESDAAGEGSAKATKAARTEKNGDGSKRGAKKAAATSATLSNTEFKAKALPLHLNLTHTPPSISKEQGSNDGDGANLANATVTGTSADAGFIGNLTLVPAVFSTGSYGWKGNKRMTVELQDGDTDAEGGKEKVQIMLTVNATVVGSKAASKSSKGKEREQEEVIEEAEHIDEDDANGE